MAEFEKQREKSGRKKSTLLPRNSTDNDSIPPHHPSRANERNGRKKNGVKKIEKKEETAVHAERGGEQGARVFRPGEGRIAVAREPEQSRASAGLIYERRENSERKFQ